MIATEQPTMTVHSNAEFWDRIAERYARRPVANEAAYQEKLRITRSYLRPDMQLLEIGCGTGSTALAHAPFVERILATDISARMIEIAEHKASAGKVGNVVFAQASVDDLEAPDGCFDAVLAMSILHLVDDRNVAIAKAARLLKPGGVLVSSTACLGDGLSVFKLIGPIGRLLGLLPFVRVFTLEELQVSLRAAGLVIEQVWRPGKREGVFMIARKPE
jgi:ubiquinone/menaquinone biosynthesis C-methylase UbiE